MGLRFSPLNLAPSSLAAIAVWAAASPSLLLAATDLLHNGGWPAGRDCVDHSWNSDSVYTYYCHGAPNQQWELTTDDQIRSAQGNCLEYFDDLNSVVAVACDATRRQKWYATNGLIKPQGFRLSNGSWAMRVGFCLDSAQPDGKLTLFGCHGATNQKFAASFLPTTVTDDVVQVDGTWPANGNCLDYDFSAGLAYVYACHGQWNQRWRFTSDDEIRVSDNLCLEYDAMDQALVRRCSKAENQKWVVLDDGHVQPKASPSKCLDASYATSKLSLAACVADKANQKFRSSVLKPKQRDLLRVKGPWAESQSCVDYAWGSEYAYIYACHGQANQLWEFTNDEQIRTTQNKCLEFDGDALARVAVKPCDSTRATQKWRATVSGAVMPRGYFDSANSWRQPNKCLDASLESKTLQLWDCVDTALNQKFTSNAMPTRNRDLIFAGHSGAGTTSASGHNCVRGLDNLVLVAKCGATREMLWEFKADGTLVLDVDGSSGSSGSGMCLTASSSGSTTTGKVELSKCSAGLASQKWERTAAGGIALQASGALGGGKCLDWTTTPTLSLVACASPVATITQTFASTIFTTVASGALNALVEKATLLSASVKTDAFLTVNVLSSATNVVKEAQRVLSSGGGAATTDTQSATTFLLQFLTKNDNTTQLTVQPRAVYETSRSEEFLVILSMLLQATEGAGAPAVLQAIAPVVQTFSDQLFEARYEVLQDHVLRGDLNRLGAYTDGTLSDFDEVGGMLSAVCRRLSSSSSGAAATAVTAASSMCRLASYFTLIDQFFQLKYRLMVEGPRALSTTSRTMARTVVETFTTHRTKLPQQQADPLWTRLMTLLVFGAPYVDVLPVETLQKASRGDAYLTTFVLYAALGKDTFVDELTPMVRFLSDQITTFHVGNVLRLTTAKDIDGLDAYLAEPFNTYSVLHDSVSSAASSDFATVAQYLVPLVCGDPAREPLSLCQLDQVYVGLQTVLRFEKSRRSNVVSLSDVLEVDVRKKLDVIDQEKKQFEMLSTLQEVANKIGTTIFNGVAQLKMQIANSTAAIRGDIEAARKQLSEAIGSVGQKLQTSIEKSTDVLYRQVGQQAASIRRDISDSSQRLEQRLDDTGRAILGSIEQSKQELKYQIGAEAERTRAHVTSKSSELKQHMSQETQGLREFIDVKTNQVIGVVREEGASTREHVNKATSQIVREVQKEGAITRAFVDTKTNEVTQVVRSESAKTREFVDAKTNQVISVVHQEARTTRSYIDEKGNQIIGVVKDEGDKTRKEVRAEGAKIRDHIDVKTTEIIGVVKDEGAKTRADVNARAAELKQHVTTQSTAVRDQVKASQSQMQQQMDKQYTQLTGEVKNVGAAVRQSTAKILANQRDAVKVLAGISAADCVDMWAPGSSFLQTRQKFLDSMQRLHAQFKELDRLYDEVMSYGGDEFAYLIWTHASFRAMYALVQFDFDEVARYQTVGTPATPLQLAAIHNEIIGIAHAMQQRERAYPEEWNNYKRMLQGENGVEFVTPRFDSFKLGRASTPYLHVGVITLKWTATGATSETEDVPNYITDWLGLPDGTNIDPSVALWYTYIDTTDHFYGVLKSLEALRVAYEQYIVPNIRCTSAKQAKAWASGTTGTRRALQQATSENEPFYAMTFTALTAVLLDYRLQEAAHQFCKYYEFRDGGVAPPMCHVSPSSSSSTTSGSSGYYSMTQIQQMRSWQPRAHPRISMRVLLPTQPAVQASTGRAYPYVDLERLAKGHSVQFDVPTWDFDWLKRHRWVLANAKPETLPSFYVESVRVYLPIEATSSSPPASSNMPFAVSVFATSSMQQYATSQQRGRVFELPPQTLSFDVVYDEPICASDHRATNPYHDAAGCIVSSSSSATANRSSSQICVVPEAVDTTQRLLPHLFSSWRIRADLDTNSTRFRIVRPQRQRRANATAPSSSPPVEWNLFADVTLVRVANANAKSALRVEDDDVTNVAPATSSSCCGSDQYRNLQSGACVSCPTNTTSALNGYTCV